MFPSQRSSNISLHTPFSIFHLITLLRTLSVVTIVTSEIILAVFSFYIFVYVCIFCSAIIQAEVVLVACVGVFSLGSRGNDSLVLGHVTVL
jgi:hypothetical protein